MTPNTIQAEQASSDALCQAIADQCGGAAILAFSCGKDAIGSWLQMRRYFQRIVPVYLYLIPGLEFVEEGLAYFEGFFGVRIMRLPHPSFYRWVNAAMWQPPGRIDTIAHLGLPSFSFQDVWSLVKADQGLDPGVFTGVGVRSADSIVRRNAILRYGAVNHKKGEFYPIFDWNKARLLRELQESGVRLPVDYQWFGRSFDGLDARFLGPIRDHAPEDYARILEWVPMADIDLFRREVMYANRA